MRDYLMILGREPELSIAEISTIVRRLGLPWQWRVIKPEYAEATGEITTDFLQAVAGTIKVAEILEEVTNSQEQILQTVVNHLPAGGRCEYGFSWYGGKPPQWWRFFGLKVKKNIKANYSHLRFVVSKSPNLSSVVVKKNKLLPPSGYEFLMLPVDNKIKLARTIWVQDFEGWNQRDYGRPSRDARVGMLPPKLARLLINLAEVHESAGILDPFCGSGTVLQEAAILGYRHLVGTDIDKQALERTRANFSWLRQSYPEIVSPALMAVDIKNLLNVLKNSSYDAVVTEPYLGPPLHGKEPKWRLEEIRKELTDFYFHTLKILSRIIKSSGRVVMIWPVWRSGRDYLTLPLINEIEKLSLVVLDVLPKEAPTEWRNNRKTLWYSRPEAKVIREIVVFKKE